MTSFWLILLASRVVSASPDESMRTTAWPTQATVTLTGCGACTSGAAMIRVPPALRSVGDPEDGSDLLLLDAAGQPVPFAVARGNAPADRTSLREWRTDTENVLNIDAPALSIDGLEFDIDGTATVGRVTVKDAATGAVLAGPTLIWTHEVGALRTVDITPTTRALRVEFVWLGRAPQRLPRVTGLRRPAPSLSPDRLTVPVVDQRIQEDGWVSYTLQMDNPLPVRALDLRAAEGAVISRDVNVAALTGGGQSTTHLGSGHITRVRVGEATLDAMNVQTQSPPLADRFVVQVASYGQPVLPLPTVDILLEGEALWFEPTGPGPYTLYGGAPSQTRPPSELQVALSELVRLPTTVATVGEATANPDWRSPVDQSGLALPGVTLPSPERFAFRAPITGETGLVRIPVPNEVLAATRPELGDIRITTDTLAQVPFLLRRTALDRVSTVPFDAITRTEDGKLSTLVVPLPDPTLPVATLTLSTPAMAFRRTVTVLKATGNGKEMMPRRSVTWNGADRPGTLGMALDDTFGDKLVIFIDNGDDPPLPIDGATVSTPGWEIVTVLPEGTNWLYFGDPRRSPVDFDLMLYSDTLADSATRTATIGPIEAQTPPPLALVDRASLLGGVVVLVVGLAALTIRLLRAVPPPESSEPSIPSEPTEPGDGVAHA